MKPIRTPESTTVYTLPGGNEDNYLYVEKTADGEIHSIWDASPEERAMLAGGARVRLTIIGSLVPPLILSVARPHCRECREEMGWDEALQIYACTCETSST